MQSRSDKGTLYLIPNLIDPSQPPEAALPAQALERLRRLSRFVVEGEKAAWRLLSKVLDAQAASRVVMERLDEHTKAEELPSLLAPLESGEDIGLISEAGMPCVADPGAALVALAHDRGIAVVPLIGPSAILLALAASGLDGQRFSFLGYLPPESAGRRTALLSIDRLSREDGATRIFIETPYRNARLLEDCLSILSPDTRLCVASSLCSEGERIRCAPVSAWRSAAWPMAKEPAIFLVGRSPSRASPAAAWSPPARPGKATTIHRGDSPRGVRERPRTKRP
jgi:Predicted methyltransferases